MGLAGPLADELVAADADVLAVPLYNVALWQHFKKWVDTATTHECFSSSGTPITAGQPAVLVTAHGGYYQVANKGWGYATGWMYHALADAWNFDVGVIESELTLAGVNPPFDDFRGLAASLQADTERLARECGEQLGRAVT